MLEIRSTPSRITVHQLQADLDMENKLPRVEVNMEQARIRIDQSQCFDEAGLKGVAALSDDMANRAKAAVLQGIDRIVAEGNMMGAIENEGNPIPEIAFNNLFDEVDYNIELMPRSGPKIDFVGGNIDVSVDEGYVHIKATPRKPQIDVQLGTIEFNYIEQLKTARSTESSKIDAKI